MLTKLFIKILTFIFLCFAFGLNAQQLHNMEYWNAYNRACSLYKTGQYEKAAEAFEIAFEIPDQKLISMHRFDAAQANAKIKNAQKTEQYLYEALPDIHPAILDAIKTRYTEFNTFRRSDWWAKFAIAIDERQDKISKHHKNLKIFKANKQITYAAIRINSNGDTLANTFIHLKFEGEPYMYDGMHLHSSLATITYEHTDQDKIDHKKELKKTKIRNEWITSKEFAVVETDKLTSMGIFFHNEFYKTWVAPEPIVYYPISDASILKAGREISDLDRAHGRVERGYLSYKYNGKVKMQNELLGELAVHHYRATKKTNIYGTNNLDYFFHPMHGFVAMIYKTFDGDIISFIRTKPSGSFPDYEK